WFNQDISFIMQCLDDKNVLSARNEMLVRHMNLIPKGPLMRLNKLNELSNTWSRQQFMFNPATVDTHCFRYDQNNKRMIVYADGERLGEVLGLEVKGWEGFCEHIANRIKSNEW